MSAPVIAQASLTDALVSATRSVLDKVLWTRSASDVNKRILAEALVESLQQHQHAAAHLFYCIAFYLVDEHYEPTAYYIAAHSSAEAEELLLVQHGDTLGRTSHRFIATDEMMQAHPYSIHSVHNEARTPERLSEHEVQAWATAQTQASHDHPASYRCF